MAKGDWFLHHDPKGKAEVHLSGWRETSIPNRADWLTLCTCPRCVAVVLYRDVRGHENWHAETDHPIPAELQAAASG